MALGVQGVWARQLRAGSAKCTHMGCKPTSQGPLSLSSADLKPAGAGSQELCEELRMETKCWCQVEGADGSPGLAGLGAVQLGPVANTDV